MAHVEQPGFLARRQVPRDVSRKREPAPLRISKTLGRGRKRGSRKYTLPSSRHGSPAVHDESVPPEPPPTFLLGEAARRVEKGDSVHLCRGGGVFFDLERHVCSCPCNQRQPAEEEHVRLEGRTGGGREMTTNEPQAVGPAPTANKRKRVSKPGIKLGSVRKGGKRTFADGVQSDERETL